jgi:hypothetical protein
MRPSLITAVLSLAATALAAPRMPLARNDTATSLFGITNALMSSRAIEAKTVYGYDVGTGAIDCLATDNFLGLVAVSKSPQNQGHDQCVLLTFEYLDWSAGRQCWIGFVLDSFSSVGGTGQLDLFSSNAPAPGCSTGWGPGNQRNNDLGRMQVHRPGPATWIQTFGGLTRSRPCPPPGTVEAYELVGVGDTVSVVWRPTKTGLRIFVN